MLRALVLLVFSWLLVTAIAKEKQAAPKGSSSSSSSTEGATYLQKIESRIQELEKEIRAGAKGAEKTSKKAVHEGLREVADGFKALEKKVRDLSKN